MTRVSGQCGSAREEEAQVADRVSHWIGGRLVAGTSGRSGPVYNPATGTLAREVDFASSEEVNAAVKASPACPFWAIGCPSKVVATDQGSPGILNRIEVIAPPNSAPQ